MARRDNNIDPYLLKHLRERGETQKIKELERPESTTFGKELAETTASFAEKAPIVSLGADLAKGLGIGAALYSTRDLREETQKREEELQDKILEEIKEARNRGEMDKIERLKKAAEKVKISVPGQEILEEAPTTRQVISSGASLALLAATGLKPKTAIPKSFRIAGGKPLKSAVKFARLQRAQKIQKALKGTSPFIRKVVTTGLPILKESAIGAGFFGVTEAQKKDATVKDIVKAAEKGALISGVVTAGAIGLGKGIEQFRTHVSPILAKKWGGIIKKLESVTEGVSPKKPTTEVEKTLSHIGRDRTFKQKAAETVLGGIEQARKLKTRLIDRFNPAWRVQKKLEAQGIPLKENEKIGQNFRQADAKSMGVSENMTDDLLGKLREYDDIKDKYTAWMTKLDFYDRAKLRLPVPGNQSVDDTIFGLRRLADEMTPDELIRAGKARKVVRDHHIKMLNRRRDAGLIDQAQVDAMLQTHPHYIPHKVILDIDDLATTNLATSFNVAKTDLKKALGSTRNIEDPIKATIERTFIANRIIERNKVLRGLIQAQEKHKVVSQMKPLVTAKQVQERRKAFEELGQLKGELGRIKGSLKVTGIENKTLNNKILKAEKRLEDLYEQGMKPVVKEEDAKLFSLLQAEIEKGISVPTGKRLLGQLPRIDVATYGQVNVNTLNRIQDIVDAHPLLSSQAKSKLITDFAKGLSRSGKIKVPQNITGTELAANIKRIIRDNRKATLDKILSRYYKGKVKGIGAGERTTTAFGLNRKILKKKFGIFKTEQVLAENEKKINQFLNTLDDKKKQIKTVVDEIKDLSAKKAKLGEQTINLYREGIKEKWVVPGDINVMVKNLDQPIRGWAWRNVITGPQRVMKRLSTKYNLSFALPNKFRDEQTAALTSRAFIEQLAKKAKVSPKKLNLTDDEIIRLYKESGGLGARVYDEGELLLSKKGLMNKKNLMNPAAAIDEINSALESSTRLEVFKSGLMRGLSSTDAAFAARNATIDFGRMGTWMRPANQAIPFLNARVQGFVNLPKAFAADPAAFTRMQFYTAVYPSLLLHQHNTRFDSYKNVSQYFKNRYWIIMTGEKEIIGIDGKPTKIPQFTTFPKGEGQVLVSNPIQYYLERSEGIDPRSVKELIVDTVGSASPLEFQSFDQSNLGGTIISQFGPVPTFIAGWFSGTHPYFGSKIVPERRKEAPTEMQYKKTTPEITKKAANILNVRPAMLEFFINSWGGVPQDVQEVIDVVYGGIGELRKTSISETGYGLATKFPLIRRFLREAPEYYSPISVEHRKTKQELKTGIVGEKLKVSEKAEKILKEMYKKETKEGRLNYLNSLSPEELTPKVRKEISQMKKSRETVEALRKYDSVELRARYIIKRLEEMKQEGLSKADRVKFLDNLEEAKILTDDIRKRMGEIYKNPTLRSKIFK